MARLTSDDSTPVRVGDSSSNPRGALETANAHLVLDHRCFRQLTWGHLAVKNDALKALTICVTGGVGPINLVAPWNLELNKGAFYGGITLHSSEDDKTVHILHFGEYETTSVLIPGTTPSPEPTPGPGTTPSPCITPKAITRLLIGTTDLTSAKLNGTELLSGQKELFISFG
jgi:hypothetical protein